MTINDAVYRAVKLRAAETDQSISHIVEAALVQQLLEDAEDIESADKRKNEAIHGFDALVAQFRAEGVL